uniref:Uncharacterized protein n=1 Tax=Nelumbo nucifera TaxID=4432 RepID=A0A822YIU6_NELNU|nr:TPA_asm: hypothetical protein HUJ06_009736 [Nelumbo nucifera]
MAQKHIQIDRRLEEGVFEFPSVLQPPSSFSSRPMYRFLPAQEFHCFPEAKNTPTVQICMLR